MDKVNDRRRGGDNKKRVRSGSSIKDVCMGESEDVRGTCGDGNFCVRRA
jgi:hypothetical protein